MGVANYEYQALQKLLGSHFFLRHKLSYAVGKTILPHSVASFGKQLGRVSKSIFIAPLDQPKDLVQKIHKMIKFAKGDDQCGFEITVGACLLFALHKSKYLTDTTASDTVDAAVDILIERLESRLDGIADGFKEKIHERIIELTNGLRKHLKSVKEVLEELAHINTVPTKLWTELEGIDKKRQEIIRRALE